MEDEKKLDAEIRHTVEAALKYYEGKEYWSAGLLLASAGMKTLVLNDTIISAKFNLQTSVYSMDDALDRYKGYIALYGEHPKPTK